MPFPSSQFPKFSWEGGRTNYLYYTQTDKYTSFDIWSLTFMLNKAAV